MSTAVLFWPGSCSSSLESALAAAPPEATGPHGPAGGGTCPALPCRLCSHLEAIPGGCPSREAGPAARKAPRPQPLAAPGLQPSPAVCSPASGLRALCPAKQPTKAGWWLKLESASSLLSVPSTWPFFTPVFFPWFFCFSARGRHHSASY